MHASDSATTAGASLVPDSRAAYQQGRLQGKTSVLVINGPNLNMLGKRDTAIYGDTTLASLEQTCIETASSLGLSVGCLQSNSESALIDALHYAEHNALGGVVLNAGAFSHTSHAIADAIEIVTGLVIEVHLSNIHARETFRHHSVLSRVANGVIVGVGAQGYVLALQYLATQLRPTLPE
ncbi:MAG: type II 3-dehydroquinate dehydratase [Alphaproteobacteria bacterium]|nr:type II 3-dehydroquinate dehydratase [Alphaproteobacteria bacterium]